MTRRLFFPSRDERETGELGALLAAQLKPGCLVLLQGDLGAGKSALARSLVRALLRQPGLDVPSPTFLLVLPYEGNGHEVLHGDLYRLTEEEEVNELGLFDNPRAIVILEWPERAPGLFGEADLVIRIDFAASGTGRIFGIDSPSRAIDLNALTASGRFLDRPPQP